MTNQWPDMVTPDGIPYGTCHPTECKQQFSLAYTHAIVAAARCTIADLRSDVERIDYTVRQAAKHRRYTSAQVDVQMKCTEQDVIREDGVHWSLSRDHYDWLRDPDTFNRKILVVLVVPPLLDDWLSVDTDLLTMRKAAYWGCLEGLPEVTTESTTVVLPNRFNVPELLGILHRVGNGGRP